MEKYFEMKFALYLQKKRQICIIFSHKVKSLPTSTYILIYDFSQTIQSLFPPKKYFQNLSLFSKSPPDTGDGDGDCDRHGESPGEMWAPPHI